MEVAAMGNRTALLARKPSSIPEHARRLAK